LIPTIDGKAHHFIVGGVYDGVFVMKDLETGTLWNHITGEAMHGPLAGRRLTGSNLLQVNVKEALTMDAAMRVAMSDRPVAVRGGVLRGPFNAKAELTDKFIGSLGVEDTRRPRMDIGLGVWADRVHRYYPIERIRARGGAFLDELEDKTLLVYIEPESSTPAALFVDAKSLRWDDRTLRLDSGDIVRAGGILVSASGNRRSADRPRQLFTRWYGFALTFPGSEVFGD
jgi:hypothetical protein